MENQAYLYVLGAFDLVLLPHLGDNRHVLGVVLKSLTLSHLSQAGNSLRQAACASLGEDLGWKRTRERQYLFLPGGGASLQAR